MKEIKHTNNTDNWFVSWFNSPYYHLLYEDRDGREAEFFIQNLLKKLKVPANSTFLDLACGKGRHARYINSLGFNTTGVDLSTQSIAEAGLHQNKTLNFLVHDMRLPIPGKSYQFVLNLFTSFGYFDNSDENLRVLNSIKTYLAADGLLIIDFLNAVKITENLVSFERIVKKGIQFNINRKVEQGIISKKIVFTDNFNSYEFEERVQALTLSDFETLCNHSGFSIVQTFGNYLLEPFNENESDRLIMIIKLNKN